MAINPLWATVALDAAGLGFNMAGSGGGMSDTQKNDERFMNDFAWKQALRNEERQKFESDRDYDFNANYLQNRTKDAIAAGLHPLVGAGVNPGGGSGSSPVHTAFVGSSSANRGRDYSGFHQMGQNIQRAALAASTADDRILAQANIDRVRAETNLIQSQWAESQKRLNTPSNPAAPDPYGGAPTGDVTGAPNKHILIKNPDGSYSWQWGPEMAFSQIGRPANSLLEDIYDVGAVRFGPKLRALGGYLNQWSNYKGSDRSRYQNLRGGEIK